MEDCIATDCYLLLRYIQYRTPNKLSTPIVQYGSLYCINFVRLTSSTIIFLASLLSLLDTFVFLKHTTEHIDLHHIGHDQLFQSPGPALQRKRQSSCRSIRADIKKGQQGKKIQLAKSIIHPVQEQGQGRARTLNLNLLCIPHQQRKNHAVIINPSFDPIQWQYQ